MSKVCQNLSPLLTKWTSRDDHSAQHSGELGVLYPRYMLSKKIWGGARYFVQKLSPDFAKKPRIILICCNLLFGNSRHVASLNGTCWYSYSTFLFEWPGKPSQLSLPASKVSGKVGSIPHWNTSTPWKLDHGNSKRSVTLFWDGDRYMSFELLGLVLTEIWTLFLHLWVVA